MTLRSPTVNNESHLSELTTTHVQSNIIITCNLFDQNKSDSNTYIQNTGHRNTFRQLNICTSRIILWR